MMKNLHATLCCIAIVFFSFSASGQTDKVPINEPDYNKPRLFDNLPDRIPVSITDLNALISAPVGRTASLNLVTGTAKAVQFDGDVVSVASQPDEKIQSVVIRSSNFNGARMTISKILNDNGTVSFSGRIISFQHGDLFELKNEAGNMVLVKRNYYELINE
jgi:hypothetical protein